MEKISSTDIFISFNGSFYRHAWVDALFGVNAMSDYLQYEESSGQASLSLSKDRSGLVRKLSRHKRSRKRSSGFLHVYETAENWETHSEIELISFLQAGYNPDNCSRVPIVPAAICLKNTTEAVGVMILDSLVLEFYMPESTGGLGLGRDSVPDLFSFINPEAACQLLVRITTRGRVDVSEQLQHSLSQAIWQSRFDLLEVHSDSAAMSTDGEYSFDLLFSVPEFSVDTSCFLANLMVDLLTMAGYEDQVKIVFSKVDS